MKKVSICTCTYNRNRYLDLLEETILGQDYPHQLIEWIVVDDSDINEEEHQFKKHDFLVQMAPQTSWPPSLPFASRFGERVKPVHPL